MSILTVKNLTAYYEKNTVFKNLNFEVEAGDFLCILGENGSGKTTLMRTLLGLGVRFHGEVTYSGTDRRQIGWLPQRTEAQKDFPADVWEVVLSGFAHKGVFGLWHKRSDKKTAAQFMETFGISDLKYASFRELSGGQQQRVLLCRALCSAESVLLLDEPMAGLDTLAQKELYEAIDRLKNEGMTVMMISHEIDRALSRANKVLHLDREETFFGTVEEYRNSRFYQAQKEGEK